LRGWNLQYEPTSSSNLAWNFGYVDNYLKFYMECGSQSAQVENEEIA